MITKSCVAPQPTSFSWQWFLVISTYSRCTQLSSRRRRHHAEVIFRPVSHPIATHEQGKTMPGPAEEWVFILAGSIGTGLTISEGQSRRSNNPPGCLLSQWGPLRTHNSSQEQGWAQFTAVEGSCKQLARIKNSCPMTPFRCWWRLSGSFNRNH